MASSIALPKSTIALTKSTLERNKAALAGATNDYRRRFLEGRIAKLEGRLRDLSPTKGGTLRCIGRNGLRRR